MRGRPGGSAKPPLSGCSGPMIATWLANRGITFTMTAYFLALSAAATFAAWRMKETAFSPLRR